MAQTNATPLTPQQEILKAYLDERAKTDELFAKTYAKENKSFERCWQYIFQEAAKYAVNCEGGKAAAILSDDVFSWAVHYYDEDGLEIDKPKPQPKPMPAPAATKTAAKKAEKKTAEGKTQGKTENTTTEQPKAAQGAAKTPANGKRAKKTDNDDLGLFAGFGFEF